MTITPGKLGIKVNTGVLKRDTELFGKMDPFVSITIGTQTKRTSTHKRGGKNPRWNGEVLEFDISSAHESEMKLTVYDEESIKKNDTVGHAVFFLHGVTKGDIVQKPIEILYKGKMAGTVYVDFDFKTRMGQNVGAKLLAGLNLGGLGAASAGGVKPVVEEQKQAAAMQ